MREHLLGYLLGALEEGEHRAVSERLERDPQLQSELDRLQDRLDRIGPPDDFEDPPVGLATRTCEFVAAEEVKSRPIPREVGRRWGWSLADVTVAAAVFAAAALLFFPAILNSQYQSELAFCQNNLRQLAEALSYYTETTDGYFPRVPTEGKRSGAGIYAPILVESGMITEPRAFVCPASELARQGEFRVPLPKAIDQMEGPELLAAQSRMGGSYGYNLGYIENGVYRSPRNRGRSTFAIMADAPSEHLQNRASLNHGGRGQNVLFDDWHIQHMTDCASRDFGDAFFTNRQGFVAAGVDANDAVIGGSADSPLLQTVGFDR